MYKIGDFSKKVDVPVKTLRYYDEISLFSPSYIDNWSGYRYYEDEQIPIIKKIVMLKDLNLSLKEIDEYMTTGDINILIKKEEEFRMKVEAITNYVEDIAYEVKSADYEEYLKWNGLRMKDSPAALEIRDEVAKYYMVFKNNEFYSDFLVFPNEDNRSDINKMFGSDELFEICLKYLKNEYDYLTMLSCETLDNSANMIRSKSNVISEEVKESKGYDERIWKYILHKVLLKEEK